MKKRHSLFAFIIVLFSGFFFVQSVDAATTISFNGQADAFGGYYQKFSAEDNLNGNLVRYAKVEVNASGGNKLKVGFLYTENWISTAKEVATTNTLSASNNSHTIYFIPKNMGCPSSSAICITVPSQYSTNGSGNDLTYDFMTGVRFTNESWFFGTLYLNGSITLY